MTEKETTAKDKIAEENKASGSELSDDQLDEISGGSLFGDIVNATVSAAKWVWHKV
jgi:bacteriocin-like protein